VLTDNKGASGTVTVTALSTAAAGRIAGTFEVTLDSADKVTGAFDTTICTPTTPPPTPPPCR